MSRTAGKRNKKSIWKSVIHDWIKKNLTIFGVVVLFSKNILCKRGGGSGFKSKVSWLNGWWAQVPCNQVNHVIERRGVTVKVGKKGYLFWVLSRRSLGHHGANLPNTQNGMPLVNPSFSLIWKFWVWGTLGLSFNWYASSQFVRGEGKTTTQRK